MPADRGDGAPRSRHAALRPDEAGGARRSAHRPAPYAVVQLRQDTLAGDHFSLVGFQTQLKWGEQARVLRLIPGLEQAEFVRFGMVHRNTYINGPTVLRRTWQTRARADLFFAGQVRASRATSSRRRRGCSPASTPRRSRSAGRRTRRRARPPSARWRYYVSHADAAHYQPTNITFGIMPPLEEVPGAGRRRASIASWRCRRVRSTDSLRGSCATRARLGQDEDGVAARRS